MKIVFALFILVIIYINFIIYKNETNIFTNINLDTNINNKICIEEINYKRKSEIIKNHLIFYNECNNTNINKENRLVFFININNEVWNNTYNELSENFNNIIITPIHDPFPNYPFPNYPHPNYPRYVKRLKILIMKIINNYNYNNILCIGYDKGYDICKEIKNNLLK